MLESFLYILFHLDNKQKFLKSRKVICQYTGVLSAAPPNAKAGVMQANMLYCLIKIYLW